MQRQALSVAFDFRENSNIYKHLKRGFNHVKDAGMKYTIKNCLNAGHIRDRYHEPLSTAVVEYSYRGLSLNRRFLHYGTYPKI